MQTKSYQQKSSAFNRVRLPEPDKYFEGQGLVLIGKGNWRSAKCPFHDDESPSLRVHVGGGFKCMSCGAKGGDVLAFHRLRTGLGFVDAAKDLSAWGR